MSKYFTRSSLLTCILTLLFSVVDFIADVSPVMSDQRPHVLILNSYHKQFSWTDDVVSAAEEVIKKNLNDPLLFVEYMDTKKINTPEYLTYLYHIFKLKYSAVKLNVIIVSDNNALDFVARYHDEVFNKTPVVFCGIDNYKESMLNGIKQFTGIAESVCIGPTIDLALNLHPGAGKVYVIIDKTPTGYRQRVEEAVEKYKDLEFEYLLGENYSHEELFAKLRTLPEDSIVLLTFWMHDRNNIYMPIDKAGHAICSSSNAPVYGITEWYFGKGIVGGKLLSGRAHGRTAGDLTVRIINGEKPSDMPVLFESSNPYMFDYEQLKRWGISISNLPADSILINKPFSFYETYKIIIWEVIAAFAVLMSLIAFLIFNIIRRKGAENALKESENRFRSMVETTSDWVWETDDNIVFKYISNRLKDMLGYDVENLIGKTVFDIMPPDEQKRVLEIIQPIIKERKNIVRLEHKCFHKDGHLVVIETNGTPVFDSKGRFLGYRGVASDITDHKKSEEDKKKLEVQLQRAEKMETIGTLAGGVAHDLNNILGAIVGYPDLLLDDIPKNSPLKPAIQAIKDSGEKAAAIVQDLLTLARRGVNVSDVVNLNNIISSYIGSSEYEKLKEFHSNVEFEIRLGEDLSNIIGSSVHLSKTIMNLASNAAESLPEGGRVIIFTENKYIDKPIKGYDRVEKGDYVVLTVTDNGIGISKENIGRIFEPFYTKKVMGRSGTGLGMSVVWGTVKDHKGYIDVESMEGRGTTIKLYFPVTKQLLQKAKDEFEINEYKGKGERILVVDDVESQRVIARSLLSKLNYNVETVDSGEKAVDYLKNNSADLLLLDMIMDPGMDGLDTFKKIKVINPDQKAIIVSGFSETPRVQEVQKLGAGEYVKKPYTLGKIGIAVKAELRRK